MNRKGILALLDIILPKKGEINNEERENLEDLTSEDFKIARVSESARQLLLGRVKPKKPEIAKVGTSQRQVQTVPSRPKEVAGQERYGH